MKIKKFVITGAITLGFLSIYGYNSYATTTNKISNQQDNNITMQSQQYCNLGHNNCNLNHNINHNNHNNHSNRQHHNNYYNESHHNNI